MEQVEAGSDLRRPEGARHLSQVDGILFIGWGPRKRRTCCHKTHDICWAILPLNLVVSKTQLEYTIIRLWLRTEQFLLFMFIFVDAKSFYALPHLQNC